MKSRPLNAPLSDPGRERWLAAAAVRLADRFAAAGVKRPALDRVRIALGWPIVASKRKAAEVYGQCWAPEASDAAAIEIFISPILSDPVETLAVLLHELIHAALGNGKGHGPAFAGAGRRLGLLPPWPSTTASPELAADLADLAAQLGAYPHATLHPSTGRDKKPTQQRLIKLLCPDCGYTVHTSRKWLAAGLPVCPCGAEFLPVDAALLGELETEECDA